MTTANELIRERVDAFVSDLNEVIRQAVLEHVQAALGGALQPTPVARPLAARQPTGSRAPTKKRNVAPPLATPVKKSVLTSADSSPSVRLPSLATEKLLCILTESGRPMTIRSLALASTLPHDVASDLVQQLADEGHVTMRRGEVSLPREAKTPTTGEPATSEVANVHQFVVRRNGERVRRLRA